MYKLLIVYSDGTQHIVEDVKDYGLNSDGDVFYFSKNGYISFVPKTKVMFFGREFDYNNR